MKLERVLSHKLHDDYITCMCLVEPHCSSGLGVITSSSDGIAQYSLLGNRQVNAQEVSSLDMQIEVLFEIGRDNMPLNTIVALSEEDLTICAYSGLGNTIYVSYRYLASSIIFKPLIKIPSKKPIYHISLCIKKHEKTKTNVDDRWHLKLYTAGVQTLIFEYNIAITKTEDGKFVGNTYSILNFVGDSIHFRDIRCLDLHSDRNLLISSSNDGTCKIWNTENRECLFNIEGHLNDVLTVRYHNGKIYSGGKDHIVKIWTSFKASRKSKEEYKEEFQISNPSVVKCILVLDEKRICIGGADGGIRIWFKDENWKLDCEVKGHDDSVNTMVKYYLDGIEYLCTTGNDGYFNLWKLQSFQ